MDTPSNESDQLTLPGVTPPGEETFVTMTRLAHTLVQLKDTAAEQEAALKTTNDRIKEISEKQLPDLMTGLGLTELTLRDGRKISIKQEYFASVPKDRMAAAIEWLETNNMAGIAKRHIEVDYDHLAELMQANIPFSPQASIHPSTLRAFVKERIEAGNPPPKELFGVHVVDRVAVKNS